jgi:hypothetical protein
MLGHGLPASFSNQLRTFNEGSATNTNQLISRDQHIIAYDAYMIYMENLKQIHDDTKKQLHMFEENGSLNYA